MRPIRRGDHGPAVVEIRTILSILGLLGDPDGGAEYDAGTEVAVRAF
ncbi:MAG: N-acetylmuramoyl-L-alanine amidase, partial [Dactylosporangium sp.]|nr:N-acetylmuramoyl-L-alanine amidase [Dactylosporangium sp.]